MALASGESQWITGAAARKEVQQLRAQSDAVITGAGTVAADDPQLNVRDPGLLAKPLEQPLRVVLDSALRAPSNRQIFSDHTLVVHGLGEGASYAETTPGAVEYLPLAGGPRNLAGLREVLAQRGCNYVLVEAGPKILGSFLHAAQEAPLWDEWICYIAPMAMGSATLPLAEFALPHLADAQRAKVVEHRMIGEDLQLRLQPAQ